MTDREDLVVKATAAGPCRNGRCGYGHVIDWNCAAKGTVNPFHNFDCPHHPGVQPRSRAGREPIGELTIPAAARLRPGDTIRITGPGSWELVP